MVLWFYTGWQNDKIEVKPEKGKLYLKVINNDPDSIYVYFDIDNSHDWNPNSFPYHISVGGHSTSYSVYGSE